MEKSYQPQRLLEFVRAYGDYAGMYRSDRILNPKIAGRQSKEIAPRLRQRE